MLVIDTELSIAGSSMKGTGKMSAARTLEGVFLDLDGVIFKGDTPIAGAREFLDWSQSVGLPYVFVTNNSARTPEQVAAKLNGMGFNETADKVITSAIATADYLQSIVASDTRVFIIGEDGLLQAIRRIGVKITDEYPNFVVVGLDRKLTYAKINIAFDAINNGAVFIGTNADPVLLTERGLEPGTGSIVEMVRCATGVDPLFIGKPFPRLFETAARKLSKSLDRILMIGDNIATDIAGAQSMGMITALVLTGQTNQNELVDSAIKPDYVTADLIELSMKLSEIL